MHRIFPFLRWLPELGQPGVLRADMVAGITVALILVPQAMAYAELGHFDRAIQVQRMMIAEVTRGKRLELAELLQDNLARYERQEACRTPWRDDDPVFYLAPIPFTLLSVQ